jgi:hypothetical protein
MSHSSPSLGAAHSCLRSVDERERQMKALGGVAAEVRGQKRKENLAEGLWEGYLLRFCCLTAGHPPT